MSITPRNESLAARDAIRSLKMGSKRFSYAERTRPQTAFNSDVIIAMPITRAAPFWASAQAN